MQFSMWKYIIRSCLTYDFHPHFQKTQTWSQQYKGKVTLFSNFDPTPYFLLVLLFLFVFYFFFFFTSYCTRPRTVKSDNTIELYITITLHTLGNGWWLYSYWIKRLIHIKMPLRSKHGTGLHYYITVVQ